MGRRPTYSKETEPASLFEDENLVMEEPKKVKEFEPKQAAPRKKYDDEDRIPCVSITVGTLVMPGNKSKETYQWVEMGSVQEVEYRDLIAEVRLRSSYIYEPRFIIQDEDFLAQHDDIIQRYGELYTPADIEYVLSLPAPQMEEQIKKMPIGARNALRDLAVRKIDSGELDSVQRVKVIDSFFGTELVLKLMK